MVQRRVRRSVCAVCAALVWFALAAGCGGEPQGGTQTGDEGDVAKPGAACLPLCGATQTCCDKQCVDLTRDPKNCGRCGNACGAQQLCCAPSTGPACSASTAQGSCPTP
jgi:hypothetical protein